MPGRPGRPYVAGITEAMQAAAERVLTVDGFSALTVDGIASEVGTSRPTFYRRYPGVAYLAFDVIVRRFGTGAPVNSGSLEADLLALQGEDVAMFSSPLFRNAMPGLLEAARSDKELATRYLSEFIGPRRTNVARVLEDAVARGEVGRDGVDIDLVCDLLVGPLFARAILPIEAQLDERLVTGTVGAVLAMLRRPVEPVVPSSTA